MEPNKTPTPRKPRGAWHHTSKSNQKLHDQQKRCWGLKTSAWKIPVALQGMALGEGISLLRPSRLLLRLGGGSASDSPARH